MASAPLDGILRHLRRAVRPADGDDTDARLLERFTRSGDADAFASVVRRHGPMVLGVCRRVLGNDADADDAFQATFLVLVRKAASLRSREALANWLYGVAHRTALEARRAGARRRAKEAQVVPREEASEAGWDDLRERLDQELARLPDKYRTVLVLCDLEGRGRTEVAARLGCPEGTVASRLARARTMLARRLGRCGPAASAGALAAALARHAAGAAVSLPLMDLTVRTAKELTAGAATIAAVTSARVASLTEGVLKSMLLSKLRIATVLLLGAALVGAATVGALYQIHAGEPAAAARADDPGAPGSPAPAPKPEAPELKEPKLRTVLGPHSVTYCVSLSPDGETLSFGGPDELVQLWDVSSGERRAALGRHNSNVNSVAFSPDGKTLAAGTSEEITVWDLKTRKETRTLKGHANHVNSVAFSPDGKRLVSAGRDNKMILWDLATGETVWTIEAHKNESYVARFSPDGKTLATGGGDNCVRLWDAATGKEKAAFKSRGHFGGFVGLAFSPDGKTLAAGVHGGLESGSIKLWDVETGKNTATFRDLKGDWVQRVAFSPDGRTLAAAMNEGRRSGWIELWDVETGKNTASWNGHDDVVGFLKFGADGKTLLSVSGDGVAKLWDLPTVK
jgi:RNA polymerase sigma factor (sigma-70 family)